MAIRTNTVMVVKNRLTQIGAGFRTSNTSAATSAVFKCQCGNVKVMQIASVKREGSKSCGCYAAECRRTQCLKHGHAKIRQHTREYVSWSKMHERCRGKENTKYWRWYGLLGITVCERWNSFEAFIEDMGPRPEGHSIDRIDGKKGYFPENCRWATPLQQSSNTTGVRLITFNGVTKTSAEWSRQTGLSYQMICKRIRRGWSAEKTLTTPSTKQKESKQR